MAFKFILGHHIKSILNDVEEKQKKDISDYAKGHLNESRLLNAPLSFNRKSWASARGEQQQNKCNKLNKPSNFVHKINIKERISPRIDALFDFSLGTSGVIPPLRNKTVKTPEVRYRLFTHLDPEKVKENDIHPETPLSLYSQLDDGVLIEELPLQEVRMPIPDIPRKAVADDKESDLPSIKGDSMTTSDASFHTKPSVLNSQDLYLQSTLGMFSKGITRKDQYKKMMDFNAEILRKNDMCELNIMSGEKVALHHAIKLDKELEDLNLSGMGPNFHRLF
ncbi:unnamed protein product [Lymnaea stagnalis]|uniref:Uncharacterized protein n=1 Tax=Lymnaea stagnalis TaxID=6523 RepID=A0AAV2HY20_LYMST